MTIFKEHRIFTDYVVNTTPYPTVYLTVKSDITLTVPAGYVLEYITFLASNAQIATLSLGTTASGIEVFTNQTINGTGTNNGMTTFGLNFDTAVPTATSLYLHDNAVGDSWNAANVTVYLVLRKIL